MGSFLSTKKQYNVIYLKGKSSNFLVPIVWPPTYNHLKNFLLEKYQYEAHFLRFHEASEHIMNVNCEESYQALVPKYKLETPDISVFYVILDLNIFIDK